MSQEATLEIEAPTARACHQKLTQDELLALAHEARVMRDPFQKAKIVQRITHAVPGAISPIWMAKEEVQRDAREVAELFHVVVADPTAIPALTKLQGILGISAEPMLGDFTFGRAA